VPDQNAASFIARLPGSKAAERYLSAFINLARFFSTHPLARDNPLKAWARFASWQLKSRLRGEVVVPWIAGQRLAVRREMTGATGNIYVGLHEFVDMMICLHFLRKNDLFMDIGANVGSYTVLASGVCRATTLAFEPDPNAVNHLKRNVEINRLDGLVTIHEYALGSRRGAVTFTVGLDTMNKVAAADDVNVQIVQQEQLDRITEKISQPTMIKIDVEGYEEEVLQGAHRILANPLLKLIELETVTSRTEQILFNNRFSKAYYNPFSRVLAQEPIGPQASNSLYVRDWSFVSTRLTTAQTIEVLDRKI
jgi:FkbM family methyltransferase